MVAPTDFETYVEQAHDVGFITWCTIGGIPYYFGNRAKPAAWTLPSGYTWSETFPFFYDPGSPQASWSAVSQATSRDGTPVSGNASLGFLVDLHNPDTRSAPGAITADVWASLLAPVSESRAIHYYDTSKIISPNRTGSIPFRDTSAMTAADVLYAGTETVIVNTVVDGTTVDLARGQFGSQKRWFGAVPAENEVVGEDLAFTSWPLSWRNRIVEIWVSIANEVNGVMVPLSSSPGGSYCRQVFRGPIQSQKWEGGRVTFVAQSIEQLLNQPVIQRKRTYTPGTSEGHLVYLETDGPTLVEYLVDNHQNYAVIDLMDTVSAGLFTAQSLLGAIVSAMSDGVGNEFVFSFTNDGKTANIGDKQNDSVLFLVNSAVTPDRCALRALGATEDIPLGNLISDPINGDAFWGEVGDVPSFYVGPTNTRIPYIPEQYQASLTGDPPLWQGSYNRQGDIDWVGARIGKEVVRLSFYSTAPPFNAPLWTDSATGHPYALIKARERIGTFSDHWVIPADGEDIKEKDHKINVGLLFDDHYVLDALRWMAISNGEAREPVDEWNRLPLHYGCGLDSAWFDHDQWNSLPTRRAMVSNGWWIEGTETLRKMFKQVAAAYSLMWAPSIGSAGYRIGVQEALPPATATPDTVINEDWLNSIDSFPVIDKDEMDLVNIIEFRAEWNPYTRKYDVQGERFRFDLSIANFGAAKPMVLELPWARGVDSIRAELRPAATRIFAEYGSPVVRITVELLKPEAYKLRGGDTVGLTHPFIPNYSPAPGETAMGIVNVPMTINSIVYHYGPAAQSFATATLLWRRITGGWYPPYAPALRLHSLVAGAQYNVRQNFGDLGFSPLGLKDITHYTDAADDTWKVHVYIPGQEGTIQGRTISAVSVDNSTITFNSALTGTVAASVDEAVVEFVPYGDTGLAATQQPFAYLADSDTFKVVLDNGGGVSRDGPRWR